VPDRLAFTAYIKPEPQGSARAFVIKGRAVVTSDNRKLKPFRSEVTRCAMSFCAENDIALPYAGKHEPVDVAMTFFLRRPESLPKKHRYPARKPDVDKLARAVLDSLTGVAFHDDGQVVQIVASKQYDGVERVAITVMKSV